MKITRVSAVVYSQDLELTGLPQARTMSCRLNAQQLSFSIA